MIFREDNNGCPYGILASIDPACVPEILSFQNESERDEFFEKIMATGEYFCVYRGYNLKVEKLTKFNMDEKIYTIPRPWGVGELETLIGGDDDARQNP